MKDRRMLFIYPGQCLCPYCNGSGVEQTTATTVFNTCDYCDGEGVIRYRKIATEQKQEEA